MSDETPNRRAEDPRFRKLFAEVGDLKGQHEALTKKVDENTAVTLCVQKNTSEIVEAWKALSGGLKVLGWLGTAAKFLSYFAMAVSAVGGAWYAVTHWGAPPAGPK